MNSKELLHELTVLTPDGEFLASYSAKGLASLNFPRKTKQLPREDTAVPPKIMQWHRTTTKALQLALSGKTPGELPPLDLSAGTEFQRSAWNALRKIAPGKTRSYAEIAQSLGQPKAVRAVGGACGANPVPILVPCHRVLAANRKLGGFSGGLDWKIRLLKREGVKVAEG
jgi:O-6-methylguanine DNA methyltransferase